MPDMMRACFCVISSSYHNVFSLTPFGSVSLTWFTHTLTPSMSKSICLLIYHHLPHFFSISSVCPASPQVNPRHARKVSPEKTVISCYSEENGFTHGYSLCFGDTSVYGCVLTEKKKLNAHEYDYDWHNQKHILKCPCLFCATVWILNDKQLHNWNFHT